VALALMAIPSKRGVVFFAAGEQISPFPRFDANGIREQDGAYQD